MSLVSRVVYTTKKLMLCQVKVHQGSGQWKGGHDDLVDGGVDVKYEELAKLGC